MTAEAFARLMRERMKELALKAIANAKADVHRR